MSRVVAFLLGLAVALPAAARPLVEADWLVELIAHENRDDEAVSTLRLGLSDDYSSKRLKLTYDLAAEYLYDTINQRDNGQWKGDAAADYRFSRSLSGLLNLSLDEVAAPGTVVDDRFATQTLADGRAGLQWDWNNGRSSWRANVQHDAFRYEATTELDADEDRFELAYGYRFSEVTSVTLAYSRFDQTYVDSAQSALDTRNDQWQLDFFRRWARLDGRLFASTRDVEFSNGQKDQFEGYGLELGYQANSRHQLQLRVARELQQTFRFNTQLGSALSRLEQAGLVDTDRIRLSWEYRGRFTSSTLSLYQDDFSYVSGAATDPQRQRGGDARILRRLNPRFSIELAGTYLDNEATQTLTELTDLSLIYQWIRSRRIDLKLRLQGRTGKEAGLNADDTSFFLEGSMKLAP